MRLQYQGYEIGVVTCTGLVAQPVAGAKAPAFFIRPSKYLIFTRHARVVDAGLAPACQRPIGARSMLLGSVACREQAFISIDEYAYEQTNVRARAL
jgi:hypothetical protein